MAILLDAIANLLTSFLPRTFAIVAVICMILLIVAVVMWIIGPILEEQVPLLIERLPKAVDQLRSILDSNPVGKQISAILKPESIHQTGTNLINSLEKVFSISLHFLSEVVFVLLMSLFLVLNPHLYTENLVLLFHPDRRNQVYTIIKSIHFSIRKWFIGRLCAMVLIETLTCILLTIIKLPFSFILGLLAGTLSFIPFIGAIVSAIPAILVHCQPIPGFHYGSL